MLTSSTLLARSQERLDGSPVVIQYPLGAGDELEGIIDLVEMKLFKFEGDKGEDPRQIRHS